MTLRLIMMGTGPFAVPTFRSLLASGHDVAVLVTRPLPAVRTRGKPPSNPMRDVAEQHGIEVIAPDDVNSPAAQKQLAALRADLLVVCDYGQLLAPETLAAARLGGINLHGSLLPKYRGAAPLNWAILQGERNTGVTVIHMTPKLDAGPSLTTRTTAIGDDETAAELEPRLAELGVAAVHEAIELLAAWDGAAPLGTPQDPKLASRAPRLKKSDGQVDWSRTAIQIHNQVRAMKPWPGTFTHCQRPPGDPMRLILHEVAVVDAANAGDQPAGARPGTVARAGGKELWIATGEGLLSLIRVQPAGKRAMDVAELLRGYPIQAGDKLGP